MNIALVLSYLSRRYGGPVTVAREIGRGLCDEGHSVSYWAPGEREDRGELATLENTHLYDFSWPRSWHRSVGLMRGLVENIPSIDLMHISGFWLHPTYSAARIAHASDIPYILRPAGTLEPWSLRRRRLKWLKKAIYLHAVARKTMDRAACLHACSMKEAHNFREVGFKGPVTIIPNGVDAETYSPGDPTEAETYWPELKGRPAVIFMSRLSGEKGLDKLVPLWADLTRTGAYRDALLVIAGPDDRGYRKVVNSMIEVCGLRSRVLLLDMVQGRRKLALLRRADIFILPSYSENFGIVVAEALACATPVITTRGTPWEELQTVNAGRWVCPEKADLSEALVELLGMSVSQRQAMGRRGRKLIESCYTWENSVSKFVFVCECILGGRTVPLSPEPVVWEKA